MQAQYQWLIELAANEYAVLALVFLGVTIISALLIRSLLPGMETRRRMRVFDGSSHAEGPVEGREDAKFSEEIQTYYEAVLPGDKNSLKLRLLQAGYFKKEAIIYYNFIRLSVALLFFSVAFYVLDRSVVAESIVISLFSAIVGMVGFMLPNFVLDLMANGRREHYRRSFPDFVDMLVVCSDAGLSIEAAAHRVAREYLVRDRAFGIHLGVMMLEVRAGKRLRDALNSLAERTGLEEATVLATLFRQSEELGVSLTRALRTHSHEMRRVRILRAEEKANALPVKLLIPLGAFIFPVTLVIVLVPVMIQLLTALRNMVPGS